MSAFSSLFGSGVDYLSATSGEAIAYVPAGGEPVTDDGAIVGNETVIDRPGPNGTLLKVRRRQFSIRVSKVPQPLLNGTVRYAGEVWAVKAIVSRDLTLTRVECEIDQTRDSSKGGHRSRI